MTTLPLGLQLSREKGFCLQARSRSLNGLAAIRVDRSTIWGNHAAARAGLLRGVAAVDAFRRWAEKESGAVWRLRVETDLRGCNLACWCALDAPCHRNILLELANAPRLRRASA